MVWPSAYDPAERDKIYKTFSLSGWAGACGHDAPMIALDALLGAGSDWEELMSRAAFHGGQWFHRSSQSELCGAGLVPERRGWCSYCVQTLIYTNIIITWFLLSGAFRLRQMLVTAFIKQLFAVFVTIFL